MHSIDSLIEEIKDSKELTFEPDTHTYKLRGVVIPSVTRIMEPLTESEYRGIPESVLDNAADKGTEVHNAIENYIKYEIIDVSSEYQGYIDGFLDWINEYKPIFVSSEMKIYHKIMRYGGTIDILAEVEGKLTLVDIKTTYNLIEKNCGVQLEGYSQALKSLGINIDRKAILHLKKDGKWEFKDFPVSDIKCLKVFDSLKRVYDYIQS